MPGTVTVACKLPHGLRLRHHRMEKRSEPVLGGGTRDYEIAVPTGKEVVLHGVAAPAGQPAKAPIVGGYALTHGIDADLWSEIAAQHKDHPAFTGPAPLVFAHERQPMVEGKAREQEKARSGLEPLDPQNLPRGIQTAKAA